MTLKKEFNIVFQPKIPHGQKRQRFLISANRLGDYIGKHRAGYIIEKALNMRTDKQRFRVQNKGIVDIYLK